MNEYQIIEKMATGGFSTVFKVCRSLDDGIFVMKRIPLSDFDEHQRRSAAQEIRVMSSLHHPFIVEQFDAFLFNDTDLCIVMAYYDGGDLDTIITRQRERDEYLSFDSAMMWFVGMCLALHYLHSKGIVHRDLKTHNVFLDRRTGEVAIGDFGVAEFVDAESPLSSPASQQLFVRQRDAELLSTLENRSTNDNSNNNNNNNNSHRHRSKSPSDKGGPGPFGAAVRGTPLYMSPEALEHGVCSPASDVWSLGCILYELLALSHPFESRDIAALVVRVTRGAREPLPAHYPADIKALIDAMLAHNPEDRPNCAQILRAPAVAVFVRKLLARRVPRDSPQSSAAERAWDAQLHALGLSTGEGDRNIRRHKNSQVNSQGKSRGSQDDDDDDDDDDDNRYFSPRCGLHTAAPAVRAHLRAKKVPASPERGASELRDEEYEHDEHHKYHKEHEYNEGHEEQCVGPSQRIRRASGNVEDMRHRPLDEVRAEVAQHRQIVQNEMRAQQHRRLAEAFECKFGNGAVRGPFNPFSARHTERRQPRAFASSDMAEQRSEWVEGSGQSGHSAGHLEVSLARRKTLRTAEALRVLGEDAFARVYEYYTRVESVDRDVRLVMKLVPDRTRWFALPLVGEIVVIDKIISCASEERRNDENKKRKNGAVVWV